MLVATVVAALVGGLILYRILRRPHAFKQAMLEELNSWICGLWYRQRRVGECTVPKTGPVVITANHTCSADPLMICAGCQYRKISFMIAREYADLPVFGWFVRAIECIPVRRDGRDVAATKQALRHLRLGKALAVFIEGRIPAPGEVAALKDGVAMLALRSGAPVIPCHISGTVYRNSVLGGLFARHKVRIRFGPPVDLGDLSGRRGREQLSRATERIYQAISRLKVQG